MNPKLPAKLAAIALLAVALFPGAVLAKSSDRDQPMSIDAGAQSGSIDGTGKTTLSGGVIIIQGTMELRSEQAELYMRDSEIVRAVFIGKQAHLKQQLDNGTWMTATADRIDYDIPADTLTLTGNYKVQSERGSNAGQRMVYNMQNGNMQSGGDGTRVQTVIQPKKKTPAATQEKK
jgi:lipopolysaccharide export system protein LptA